MKKDIPETELEKKLKAEAEKSATETEPTAPDTGNKTEAAAVPNEEQTETSLEEQAAALAEERDQLKDQVLRLRAEFDNYRKRTARDIAQIRKTAAQGLISEMLGVMDNLERALAHANDPDERFVEGLQMVAKQFVDVLANQGVQPIAALGEPFDPNVHEALSQLPSADYPANVVMEEFQRGYMIGDYVLRPAKVVVSGGAPDDGADKKHEEESTEETVEANQEG